MFVFIRKFKHLVTFAVLLLSFFSLANAETETATISSKAKSLPPLENSMSYYQVIKLWGSPTEKIEKEVKREVVWQYDDSKVIFQDGKVIGWMTEGQVQRAVRAEDEMDFAAIGTSDDLEQDDSEVEEILRDIMKEPISPPEQSKPEVSKDKKKKRS